MAKSFLLNLRVTTQERERIRNAAVARGFSSSSAFIRNAVLEKDLWLEKKVQEIYLLVKETNNLVKKNQPI